LAASLNRRRAAPWSKVLRRSLQRLVLDVAEHAGWVCIVCFREATREPGNCPRDGVPLSPLDDAEVLAALRERVRRRAAQRESLRFGLALVTGALLAWPLCRAFGWQFLPRAADGIYSSTFAFVTLMITIVLGALSLLLVRPLSTDGEAAALLRRLGVDVSR
jgi:hypothetical protein